MEIKGNEWQGGKNCRTRNEQQKQMHGKNATLYRRKSVVKLQH